jgi:uncharacterized protein
MNLSRWFHAHSLKLLAIRDTPEAIAGGIAIGIFFGFTPLWGFKTLLSIFFAWLTRSNILAAVLAGTLHDVIFPFMPLIWRLEYDIGYWIMYTPHQMPPHVAHLHWKEHSWQEWVHIFIFGVGRPWLVGSIVFGIPFAILSFFFSRSIVARHQKKRRLRGEPLPQQQTNPS